MLIDVLLLIRGSLLNHVNLDFIKVIQREGKVVKIRRRKLTRCSILK